MEKEYKILTCASYGASGSGIITNYLEEFDNIYNPGDFEFRFIQDFGGITTLEDALVHSHHRLNSDTAILLFKKYVDYQSGDMFAKRYSAIFRDEFKKISYEFIDALVEAKWDGHWEEDQVLSSKLKDVLYFKIWTRIKMYLDFKRKYIASYYPSRDMYFSNPSYEEFCFHVKKYLNKLFNVIDPSHSHDFIYLDQLLPPVNCNRYFEYFDNLHLIVVDRDPRDYYIENVIRWKEKYLPHDIDSYIMVYKGLRKKMYKENDHENIMRINMEDTIYKYSEFVDKINSFIGEDENHHINKLKRFNPNVSINNTQLWKKYNVDDGVIHKIEDELSEYCYTFPVE